MPLWDAFVKTSRNGTFLFERAYMDYHSDRFQDHSLVFLKKNRLFAVLPANEEDGSLITHRGLTFGGFILDKSARTTDILDLFETTIAYLRSCNFTKFVYKSVPTIYHQLPSEEEEYALWINGARLDVCNISTAIDLRSVMKFPQNTNRARNMRKAMRSGYIISETTEMNDLWQIVEHSLISKYGVTPVHSQFEISLLQSRFPKNIRTFIATLDGKVAGGIVMYETQQVAHSQYAHATPEAKSQGVIDLLYNYLIDYYKNQRPEIRFFDFGISNENKGRYLNANLISYKEDLGGRGITYKTYVIDF